MNHGDVAHRWANKDFGKYGTLTAGRVSCNGRDYYSYGTVFGQWLDMEKNVVLVYNGSTSPSSRRHQIWKSYFPDDVHVFPYDDRYFIGGYGYHGCQLVWGITKDSDFTYRYRVLLLDYFIDVQFKEFKNITTTKSKGAENVSFSFWEYALELCSLYSDTTMKKWLKIKGRTEKDDQRKKKMVSLLLDGVRDVETITDALYGNGTFKTYMDYSERFRNSDRKKRQMEWLCNRLGIESPYVGNVRSSCRYTEDKLTAKEIRRLTAKERIDIHFKSIAYEEWKSKSSERCEKYGRNKRNAYVWIVGYEPVRENKWTDDYRNIKKVRNKYTGEEYDTEACHDLPYFLDWEIIFNYDQFRKSIDKEKWIQDFYAKCKRHNDNLKALRKLQAIHAHRRNKERSYDTDRYIIDDYLRQNTTDEEYALCVAYINAVDKHYADEEARRRAEAIRRQREEEERQRERELQEKIRKEQIDACIAEGIDGCRKLWRMHFTSLGEAIQRFNEVAFADEGSFYYGGNVLMRFNMDKTIVETSKSIRLDVQTCKKFWRLVNIWHNNPSKFNKCEIDTHFSGTYTITSYENDVLTAGCHKIAYAEMERMYNEIVEHEKEVA